MTKVTLPRTALAFDPASPVPSRRAFIAGSAAMLATLAATPQVTWAKDDSAVLKGAVRGLAFDQGTLLVAAENGVWRHDNDGKSLRIASQPDPGRLTSLATHPDRPGLAYATEATGGVLRSDDGGRTWRSVGSGLPQKPANAIAIAAHEPDVLYLAIQGDGLWQSRDGAKIWEFVMDRPLEDGAERDVLTLASVNSATGMGGIWIYAGTDRGLTRLPDCFCRWQDVQAGDAMDALVAGEEPAPEKPLPEGEPLRSLALAPKNPEVLFAALPSGVWKSTDTGVAWAQMADAPVQHVAVNPADPNHVVAAGDGAIRVSRDGGLTWTMLNPN